MSFNSQNQKAPVEEKAVPQWRIPTLFSDLPPEKLALLEGYQAELQKFNRTINLISPNTALNADLIHFADSILAVRAMQKACTGQTLYDIGSGNGFPGLIFAILNPLQQVVLLDRDTRKAEFLKHVAGTLKLSNVQVDTRRIEDLKEGSISLGVSRGFASIAKALLATRRVFANGGQYFHLKGDNWARELAEIPSQLCSFWEPGVFGDYPLPPKNDKMLIIVTKKIA